MLLGLRVDLDEAPFEIESAVAVGDAFQNLFGAPMRDGERQLGAAPLGYVADEGDEAPNLSVGILLRHIRGKDVARAIMVGNSGLERNGFPGQRALDIGLDIPVHLLSENVTKLPADDVGGRLAEPGGVVPVAQAVPAIGADVSNAVRRGIDDEAELLDGRLLLIRHAAGPDRRPCGHRDRARRDGCRTAAGDERSTSRR